MGSWFVHRRKHGVPAEALVAAQDAAGDSGGVVPSGDALLVVVRQKPPARWRATPGARCRSPGGETRTAETQGPPQAGRGTRSEPARSQGSSAT